MSKSGPLVFISTSTTIVEIDMIRRNFMHFGKKINEKVTGDAQDNHHVVMESLDVLSSYVAGLTPELNLNWFVSYVKIRKRGESIVLTNYKVRNVRIIYLYTIIAVADELINIYCRLYSFRQS
jgi:hypothetical protein